MRLRIVKVSEPHLKICMEYSVWASEKARFKSWEIGDRLLFTIDKHMAALAIVSGASFESIDVLWESNLYPYRIPLKFTHLVAEDGRLSVADNIRDILIRNWGKNYGFGILQQFVLEGPDADEIVDKFNSIPNLLN
ncbi:hypothetical protein [Geobacter sp.]|uniref:hypothetical protein n=1 Tax=Geobacter sp. TaxID=46610 RepID=UPI001AC405BD|nr:hypothetical protein [Geobacter sp.]CAG0942430.1 hypothetical protein BROC_01863 [Candidatus Brocadiaceae bacterium]